MTDSHMTDSQEGITETEGSQTLRKASQTLTRRLPTPKLCKLGH
jgi:hypothetical protein